MRYTLAAVALIAAAGSAHAAPSNEAAELEQTVRAASRFEAIARVCPTLIPTDVDRSRLYSETYIKAARRFDQERTNAMMPDEMKRRIAEVQITGEQRWCEDQRRYLHEVGAGEVFPVARQRRR